MYVLFGMRAHSCLVSFPDRLSVLGLVGSGTETNSCLDE